MSGCAAPEIPVGTSVQTWFWFCSKPVYRPCPTPFRFEMSLVLRYELLKSGWRNRLFFFWEFELIFGGAQLPPGAEA